MWDPYVEFETTILPNGLTVYVAHWRGRPWQHFSFVEHGGSKKDKEGLEGTTHFVEHLVTKNASIAYDDIGNFFKDVGGKVMLGETSHNYTGYSFSIPSKAPVLSEALEIFGSMLVTAQLSQFIERERQVILGEFRRSFPNAFAYALALREDEALFGKDKALRYGQPMGAISSIERISQSDLQALYDTSYVPANMSIVSVGGLSTDEIVERLLASPFGLDKKGVRESVVVPLTYIPKPSENRHAFKFSDEFKGSTKLEVGRYKSVGVIPSTFHDSLFESIADMLESVLTDEIRAKRSWCYHIGTSVLRYHNCKTITIQCNGLALAGLDSIEEIVEQCIVSLYDKQALFEQKKSQELAQAAMKEYTGAVVFSGASSDVRNYQRIITATEDREALKKLSFADIKEGLSWLIPERRWTMLMSP